MGVLKRGLVSFSSRSAHTLEVLGASIFEEEDATDENDASEEDLEERWVGALLWSRSGRVSKTSKAEGDEVERKSKSARSARSWATAARGTTTSCAAGSEGSNSAKARDRLG